MVVKFKEYKQLDGSVKNQVSDAGNSILRRFDKTPFPTDAKDVICPHFMLLAWANGCPYNCSWCLKAETLVLTANKHWKPIKELKVGDEVAGIETGKHTRRLVKTKILAKSKRTAKAFKLEVGGATVTCSDRHRWLSEQNRWSPTFAYMERDRGLYVDYREQPTLKGRKLAFIGKAEVNDMGADYQRGYICGVSDGDGTWRSNHCQPYYQLVMKDTEALLRVKAYISNLLGIDLLERTHVAKRFGTREIPMVCKRGRYNVNAIVGLLEDRSVSKSFMKGYVAGFFDAEGSYSYGILRFAQKTEPLLAQVQNYLQELGFSSDIERPSDHNPMLRLVGGQAETLRFFANLLPAIERKQRLTNFKMDYAEVEECEEQGKQELYDIQTGTGNFIAEGLVSHNCYLKGTFRFLGQKPNGRIPQVFKDRKRVEKDVRAFLQAKLDPEIIDTGELSDCYDDQTEILTEDGWKLFTNLAKEDKVAALENGFLKYQRPTAIIQEPYKGKMLFVTTKEVDLAVTPNHKLWMATRRYEHGHDVGFGSFQLVKAKEVACRRIKMQKKAKWIGEELETFELAGSSEARYSKDRSSVQVAMQTWLEFFGYYLSEGSAHITDRGDYRVFISQSKNLNAEKYLKIRSCLSRMPFKFTDTDDGFYSDSRHMALYLVQFGKAEDKFIPKEIKALSGRQLKILLDALILGDGSISADGSPRVYYTCSRRLADDVQEILLKVGYAGTVSTKKQGESAIRGRSIESKATLYSVGVNKKYLEPVINHSHSAKKHFSWNDYDGMIYCCTVPSHVVFVRRNGKVVWSGNSLMDEGSRESLPFSKWLMQFFEGTKHKVLFLSKSTNIEMFLKNDWQKNAILAWSINAPKVSERWEMYAPTALQRLVAAKKIADAGYEVRLRIDPMVPIENWHGEYAELVKLIEPVEPSRVTLGCLRGLTTTIIYCKDKSWLPYLTEKSSWGKKPPFSERLEMYSFMTRKLNEAGVKDVGVCKETLEMWKELAKCGLNYRKMTCNCVW